MNNEQPRNGGEQREPLTCRDYKDFVGCGQEIRLIKSPKNEYHSVIPYRLETWDEYGNMEYRYIPHYTRCTSPSGQEQWRKMDDAERQYGNYPKDRGKNMPVCNDWKDKQGCGLVIRLIKDAKFGSWKRVHPYMVETWDTRGHMEPRYIPHYIVCTSPTGQEEFEKKLQKAKEGFERWKSQKNGGYSSRGGSNWRDKQDSRSGGGNWREHSRKADPRQEDDMADIPF